MTLVSGHARRRTRSRLTACRESADTCWESSRKAGRSRRNKAVCVLHPRHVVRPRCSCRAHHAAVPAPAFAPGDACRRDCRAASGEGDAPGAATTPLGRGVGADLRRSHWSQQPSGFYPYFDSVYSGGGFTLGAGYRQFTGDRTHVNVAGLYSAAGLQVDRSRAAPRRVTGPDVSICAASAGWRDATQVAYHGLGIDSPGRCRHGVSHAAGLRRRRPDRAAGALAAVDRRRGVRRLHAEGSDWRSHLGRRHLHPRDRARCWRQPGRFCTRTHRRGASTRGRRPTMRGAAACTRSRVITSPIATTPTASTGSMPRSCSTFRSCARTG